MLSGGYNFDLLRPGLTFRQGAYRSWRLHAFLTVSLISLFCNILSWMTNQKAALKICFCTEETNTKCISPLGNHFKNEIIR